MIQDPRQTQQSVHLNRLCNWFSMCLEEVVGEVGANHREVLRIDWGAGCQVRLKELNLPTDLVSVGVRAGGLNRVRIKIESANRLEPEFGGGNRQDSRTRADIEKGQIGRPGGKLSKVLQAEVGGRVVARSEAHSGIEGHHVLPRSGLPTAPGRVDAQALIDFDGAKMTFPALAPILIPDSANADRWTGDGDAVGGKRFEMQANGSLDLGNALGVHGDKHRNHGVGASLPGHYRRRGFEERFKESGKRFLQFPGCRQRDLANGRARRY